MHQPSLSRQVEFFGDISIAAKGPPAQILLDFGGPEGLREPMAD
jgi:hypothetical protein